MGDAGGRRGTGSRGIKGGKWDNCNSIINKIYFKNKILKKQQLINVFLPPFPSLQNQYAHVSVRIEKKKNEIQLHAAYNRLISTLRIYADGK